MKIMAPISDTKAIEPLIEAGADSFYIGFQDYKWLYQFGQFEEINRMSSFEEKANFPSIDLAKQAARIILGRKKDCFLTLNSAVYAPEQADYLMRIAIDFADMGCGLIVGDVPFAQACVRNKIPVTLSTMAGIYNSESVAVLQRLGLRRMILPRDISLYDMEKIIRKNPKMAFEVFLMRNGCRFADSNCMAFHARARGSFCRALDESKSEVYLTGNRVDLFHFANHDSLYKNAFHKRACGLCAVYRMLTMHIQSAKVVGRADYLPEVLRDIALVKRCIIAAQNASSEAEYLKTMQIPSAVMENCLYGLNCYYPEVRFFQQIQKAETI